MTLQEIAKVLRSKNAGPFQLTLDVIFADSEIFERVLRSGALTEVTVAERYNVPTEVVRVIPYPPAFAIKVVIPRAVASGDADDTDVLGAQQHSPLLNLAVPA